MSSEYIAILKVTSDTGKTWERVLPIYAEYKTVDKAYIKAQEICEAHNDPANSCTWEIQDLYAKCNLEGIR